MELLRGRAGHVAAFNAPGTISTGDVFDTAIQRHCTFSLGDREVRYAATKPPVVRNGDDVVVVGETDQTGVLNGLAYVNVTRGVGDAKGSSWPWKLSGGVILVLGGLGALLFAALLLIKLFDPQESDMSVMMLVFVLIFALLDFWVGAWLFGRGKKFAQAIKMIQDASNQAASRGSR